MIRGRMWDGVMPELTGLVLRFERELRELLDKFVDALEKPSACW